MEVKFVTDALVVTPAFACPPGGEGREGGGRREEEE